MTGDFTPWGSKRKPSLGWIEDENGCHIWTGGRNKGYAYVGFGGRSHFVYRLRYEREIGPIPDGLGLDHYVCDNGAGGCCNPHHCRPVTQRENVLRSESIAARSAARTHCPQGHALSGSNLRRTAQGRTCRQCRRDLERRRYWRARVAS